MSSSGLAEMSMSRMSRLWVLKARWPACKAENSGRSSTSVLRLKRLFTFFQLFQDVAARSVTACGSPAQFGNLDAVGPVRHPACDLMQEDHIALPFAHPHRRVVQAVSRAARAVSS